MYNDNNNYPCSNCAYGAYPCSYCYNQLMYNPDFMREFDPAFEDSRPIQDKSLAPLKDYGPQPFVIDIDEATKRNDNYRTTLWTGKHLQLTLMSIKVRGDIGLEVHPKTDQFLRIEEGEGIVQMGPRKNNLNFQRKVYDGFAIFIPAGTWHNVINTGNRPLKLYAIYAPPHHPHGTVHATKEIAHGGREKEER